MPIPPFAGPPANLAGVPVVRTFAFAYNTPNLDTGVAFYTPAVGEVLLNQWFIVTTAWNAGAAHGDFGNFIAGAGFYGATVPIRPPDMTSASSVTQPNTLGAIVAFSDASTNGLLEGLLETSAGTNPVPLQFIPGSSVSGSFAPVMFQSTDPLEVVVSTDGTNTGGPTGATMGAGSIGIMTVKPLVIP